MDLFHRLNEVDGNLSVFAEDLGIITDDVRQLLTETGYPGMNVLQFAFVKEQESVYLPFHQKHNSICYTGTHDNDTLLGWLHSLDDETRRYVFRFTRSGNCEDCAQALFDLAWQSNADTCIVPLQDLLGLGSESRINKPSVPEGNWRWRMPKGCLSDELSHLLRERNETYFR